MRHVIHLTASLTLLASLPAAAQNAVSGVASKGFHPTVQSDAPLPARREAPPPGIPGAQSRDQVATSRPELDVPPTEALFDAINRGDMTLARDSLNRGADFNGRNVLGMTPLELSVDLSRNDITFLLLSLRGQAAVSGPPPVAPPVGRPAVARRSSVAETAPARGGKTGSVRPPTELSATTTARPPAVNYASVPASPAPQVGFLGFGATATP